LNVFQTRDSSGADDRKKVTDLLCHSTAVSDRFYATNPDEAEARRVRQIIDSALEPSAQSHGTGGPRSAESPESGAEGPDSGAEGPDSGLEGPDVGPDTPKKVKKPTSTPQREREGQEVSQLVILFYLENPSI